MTRPMIDNLDNLNNNYNVTYMELKNQNALVMYNGKKCCNIHKIN